MQTDRRRCSIRSLAGRKHRAWGINDAGTVIVGQSSGIAVMWIRESTATPFGAANAARDNACKGAGSSIAYAVNADLVTTGTVVGQACGLPVAWKVNVAVPPAITQRDRPSQPGPLHLGGCAVDQSLDELLRIESLAR
jgi:hypothetical protein